MNDWTKLAEDISNQTDGILGDAAGKLALESILGESFIKETVDKALQNIGSRESEIAMNSLAVLQSQKAAHYAYTIYQESTDPQRRTDAVWLLKHIRHIDSYHWLEDILQDEDGIVWGIQLLEQLLLDEKIDVIKNHDRTMQLIELAQKTRKKDQKEELKRVKSLQLESHAYYHDKIQWRDFEKVEMHVGTILQAENFEKARRPAYKLLIDFGPLGKRKTSAQITDLYTPAELIGRQVMAVVNFPEKQIANFMSQCLTMGCYAEDNSVVLLQPERKVANGSKVG